MSRERPRGRSPRCGPKRPPRSAHRRGPHLDLGRSRPAVPANETSAGPAAYGKHRSFRQLDPAVIRQPGAATTGTKTPAPARPSKIPTRRYRPREMSARRGVSNLKTLLRRRRTAGVGTDEDRTRRNAQRHELVHDVRPRPENSLPCTRSGSSRRRRRERVRRHSGSSSRRRTGSAVSRPRRSPARRGPRTRREGGGPPRARRPSRGGGGTPIRGRTPRARRAPPRTRGCIAARHRSRGGRG